jgi:hypothetical protein
VTERPATAPIPRPPARAAGVAVLAGLLSLAAPSAALELEETYLLDVRLGSARADIARSLGNGGYELSDGTPIDFEDWYQPRLPEMTVMFLSQVSPRTGVVWGLSTGERGEKYRIDPGLWLGLVHRMPVGRNADVTFTAMSLVGGDFREDSCTADFGEIGGIATVNCRLAASRLRPEDTLDYLVREDGASETVVSIRYEFRF